MAHSNGRIYIDTTTTPHRGVEIADLQQVLGRGTGDLGLLCSDQEWYDTGNLDGQGNPIYALRPVNRINKWAKYKPVKQSGLDFASQRNSDFTWKSTANWWKAHNGQCGMSFTTFSQLYVSNDPFNVNSFLRKLKDGDLQWTYEAPTGGINQYPFRMFDFLQYDHNAPKPVSGVYDNLQLYDNGKLTVQLDESRAGESLGIQLSDLVINNASTDNWYVGMLIYKNDNLFQFAFSTQTIGNGGNSVEFTGMTNFAGQVTIVPFLSSVRSDQGTDPGAGTFLSCDVAPQTVTIRAEQQNIVTMTIDAQWKYALPGPVSYDVRIINNSGATISVANMVIALYDGDPDNGGVRVEYKPTIETFNMSNGTVHDESGTFNNQNYDPTKTYYVVVSSSRSEVNGKKDVEQFRG